jgi:predicted transcriptional regulator
MRYEQNKMVTFRCNDDLAEWLNRCAKTIGVDRSTFIRASLYETNPKNVAHALFKLWEPKVKKISKKR